MPELDVRSVSQRYTRLDAGEDGPPAFRYQSDSFQADLSVDDSGFVVAYPGLWRRVTAGQAEPGAMS